MINVVGENKYRRRAGLLFQVTFLKVIDCKLRSRRLHVSSWWLFVQCFLNKLNPPTRIMLRVEVEGKTKQENIAELISLDWPKSPFKYRQ